jgi:hypothetical protein
MGELLLLYDVLLTRFGVFEYLPPLSNNRLRLIVHNNTYKGRKISNSSDTTNV